MAFRRIIDFFFNPDGETQPSGESGAALSRSSTVLEQNPSPSAAETAASLNNGRTGEGGDIVPEVAAGDPLRARCGIALRPWDYRYAEVVCEWRNDMRFLHLWNSSRKPSTREEFWADMSQMLEHTTFFLVHLEGREEPIGCIYANRPASRAQKFLQINILLVPEYRRKLGFGMAATYLFIRHLFEEFDISKVVLDVYGWNVVSIKSTSHQARLEGVRRNHVYWDGRAYDLYEFGVSREAFHEEVMKSPAWKRLIGPDGAARG